MATEKQWHQKPTDSTLRRMKKEDLIAYIRFLQRSRDRANYLLEQQSKKFGELMKERCDKCLKNG